MGGIIFFLYIVARWLIFEKIGRAGWESLIPFYSTYVLCEVLYNNGMLVFLICIPIINIIFLLKLCMDLALELGRSKAFGLGIFFFPFIFYFIALFGDTEKIKDSTATKKNSDTMEKIKEAIRTEKPKKTVKEEKKDDFSELSSKLNSLKSMKDNGLIDEVEYNEKREALFEAYRNI